MRKTSKSGVDLQIGTDVEVTAGIEFGKEGKAKGSVSATATIPPIFTRAWGKSSDFQSIESLFSEKKAVVAISFHCLGHE